MKIVSDFDGVWTDPTIEATIILGVIAEELAASSGASRTEVDLHLRAVAAEILLEPARHGWEIGGALTAFADEDLFILNNAICTSLERGLLPLARPALRQLLAETVREALGGGARFAYDAYHKGSARALAAHSLAVEPGSVEVLRRLQDAGAEVVIVSNSSEDKVVAHFANAGIEVERSSAAGAGAPPPPGKRSRLRARGHACKFLLDDPPAAPQEAPGLLRAERRVRVDRGRYRTLLLEERPDLVIGDVFSLDLALPMALREARGLLPDGVSLLLKRNRYTPEWALSAISGQPQDGVVADLQEMAVRVERRLH